MPCFRRSPPALATALGEDATRGTGLYDLERRLLDALHSPWSRPQLPLFLVYGAVLAGSGALIWLKPPHTFEPGFRNWIVVGYFMLSALIVVTAFARLLIVWNLVERLLRRLAQHPVVDAFVRLPDALARSLEAQLAHDATGLDDLAYPVRALRRVGAFWRSASGVATSSEKLLQEELRKRTLPRIDLGKEKASTPADAAVPPQTVGSVVESLLTQGSELARHREQSSEEQRKAIDDYLAALLAVFIPRYLRHVRILLPTLILGGIVSVMLTSLYLVQPQRLISSLVSLWSVVVVVITVLAHSSLARLTVIRNMTRTSSKSFIPVWAGRFLVWGLVPLLSVVATKYPEFGLWVASFVESVAKGL